MGLLPPPIPILLLCLAISTSVSGYLNIFISHHEVMKLMGKSSSSSGIAPNPLMKPRWGTDTPTPTQIYD